MKETMLTELPLEERKQILRDSCDQIEERHYTRKFDQTERNQKREILADVSIQISEISNELKEIRAEFKSRLKPLEDNKNSILDEIKAGGEFVKGECYKFIDNEEGKVGYYTPEGYLLEQRDLRPEEKQRSIFQINREGTNG